MKVKPKILTNYSDAEDTSAKHEHILHPIILESIQAQMPSERTIASLSELYKIFGDQTRLKIMCTLLRGEMCVCDIAALLGTSCSAISHQLRILRQNRLVKVRREGKQAFYALDDSHVASIISAGLDHINE